MKLFPSLETMLEATEPLEMFDPLSTVGKGPSAEFTYTDRKEYDMWKARFVDGRRVHGTLEGLLDCPQLFVTGLVKGRLS